MATVNDLYVQCCLDWNEDGGLVLGIVTVAQFIDICNEVTLDFLTQTGIIRRIYTVTVEAGVSQYTLPDDLMRADDCFIAGRYLEQTTVQSLNNNQRNWRRELGLPKAWHGDMLPIKTIEIAPIPSYNGDYIPGPNEPNPPHAAYDQFWASAVPSGGGPAVVESPAVHRDLTIVGPRKPTLVAALTDPIPLLPDDIALSYLGWGILERVYGSDCELKSELGQQYAKSMYDEGVNLMRAISGEVSLQ